MATDQVNTKGIENPLVGRKRERKTLKEALKTTKPELIAVVGRRRVGKTYLIKEAYRPHMDFVLSGLQYANKSEHLQSFAYAMRQYFPTSEVREKPEDPFPDSARRHVTEDHQDL